MTGQVDVAAVLSRRDAFISNLDDSSQASWLDGIGAELVRGHGRLAGVRQVEVTGSDGATRRLTARLGVVVATGTRAAVPPVEGLRQITSWDNRDVTTAKQIPARLLVLGGGVVGVEMAQAYRRLGAAEVTVVEMADRLLANYEPWVGRVLADVLSDDGITVLTGRTAERAERDGTDGPVTLTLDHGTKLVGDEVLVAAGRTYNTDDIGLDALGLSPGGPLEVDDQLRVTAVEDGWLCAAGDVNGRALLTHMGKYQARQVGDVLAGKPGAAWADHRAGPQVVFTDPEVAAVGLTEQQARDAGIDVKVVTFDTGAVAGGALIAADPRGRAQLVIDQTERVVVGATFVGPQVGEMLQRGNHRDRREGAGRHAVARRAVVSDAQRGLAAAPPRHGSGLPPRCRRGWPAPSTSTGSACRCPAARPRGRTPRGKFGVGGRELAAHDHAHPDQAQQTWCSAPVRPRTPLLRLADRAQAAQQESLATSRLKVWAASLSPSAMVR